MPAPEKVRNPKKKTDKEKGKSRMLLPWCLESFSSRQTGRFNMLTTGFRQELSRYNVLALTRISVRSIGALAQECLTQSGAFTNNQHISDADWANAVQSTTLDNGMSKSG